MPKVPYHIYFNASGKRQVEEALEKARAGNIKFIGNNSVTFDLEEEKNGFSEGRNILEEYFKLEYGRLEINP